MPRANSIARPDNVNNFVQTRLVGEFLIMLRHHA